MHRKAKHQAEQGACWVQLKEIRLHRNESSMGQSRAGGKGLQWATTIIILAKAPGKQVVSTSRL
jgi:hypothetical protein